MGLGHMIQKYRTFIRTAMHGTLFYGLNELSPNPKRYGKESQKLQVLRSTAKVEAQLHLPAQGPRVGDSQFRRGG